MLKVLCIADGFSPPFTAVNGHRDLIMDWPHLVWSAITIGRANCHHVLQHGHYSLFEIVYRTAMVYANLKVTTSGRLVQTRGYRALDPSEKAAVSFFLGMTASKAFVDIALDVPWLMHLDVYRERLQPVLSGRSRPDFAGQTTSGEWVVIESKGRTNGFDQATLSSAKRQVQMLGRVSGANPVVRAAIVTHFSRGTLQLRVSDPPTKDRDLPDLNITRQQFFGKYYALFLHLLKNHDSHSIALGDSSYRAVYVPAIDVTVGLRADLLDDPVNPIPAKATKGEDFFAGSDGVFVRLGESWTSNKMQLEPNERYSGVQ